MGYTRIFTQFSEGICILVWQAYEHFLQSSFVFPTSQFSQFDKIK